MVGTYGSALLICLVALTLGRGICVLAGQERSPWLAAPLGLAALMVISEVAISLPGHGWTAVGAVLIASGASLLVCRRRGAGGLALLDALPVGGLVLLLATVPFLVNGRVGVLGVSYLNDTHWHLFLAQGLLEPAIRHLDDYGIGYPVGPHAVAATFARGLGSSVDNTLTGLLVAIPVLTGLAALGLLTDLTRARRWLAAVLAAVPYLAAADYVQSAFKEPILSLLLIGFVTAISAGRAERFRRPAAVAVPLAVLTAGVLYDYSYPGLVWPLAMLAFWLLLELAFGGWRRLAPILRGLRSAGPSLGVAALVLILIVAPDLLRLYHFWHDSGGSSIGTAGGVTASSLANLVGPLPLLEGTNLWLWGDFRFGAPDTLLAGALAGFAIVVLVFAIVRAIERRDLAWLGAIGGFAVVYAYVKHAQSPYVASKALAVPASLLMLGSGAALLRELDTARWRSAATLAVGVSAVVFFGIALRSSYDVLKDGQVDPTDHFSELRSLRTLLHGRPTLFLVYDDYFKWELLGEPASSLLLPSPIPAFVARQKPWSYGQALDFDSVNAATLNRFDYVITTRTLAQSQPPPNFVPVGHSASYEVWRRHGLTRAFGVLRESGAPGAVLNCRTSAGRALAHRVGTAAVREAPTYLPLPPLVPGERTQLILRLAAGEWNLSLPFTSTQAVIVRGAGLRVRLPPNLDRSGSEWPVGTVRSEGTPLALTLTVDDPGLLAPEQPLTQYFTPESLVAVPNVADQLIPLRGACGRYLDWYELG